MKNKVLHLVRKNTQLKASFINNQITNHNEFEPLIAFRKSINKKYDGGFGEIDLQKYKYLDLSQDETEWEKFYFKTIKHLSKRQVKNILEFIEQEKIDICHFHYGTDCGVYYPLSKHLRIPSVVSFYGYDAFSFPKRFLGYGKKYLYNRVFSQVSCVLAMSEEMKNDLLKIGCLEGKIVIHYHGVPSGIFSGLRKTYEQGNENFTLLNISCLDPVKGHIFIFKAIKNLIEKGFTNIKLKIIGHGYYESVLKKYIIENNLNKYVRFLGPLQYGSKEMISELKNADAFIHPSVITKDDKEGIPGALVEAMFAGLPVISTYHGGIPYVIEDNKTGLLVNEWDVDGLSMAIEKLMNNKNLREQFGKTGMKYAVENLDLNKKEKELEEIYQRLIYEYGKKDRKLILK
jgi:colanic acid/amylovoran biosynthesis glycosyltransferase